MKFSNVFSAFVLLLVSFVSIVNARPQQAPEFKPQGFDGFVPMAGDIPKPQSRKIVFPGKKMFKKYKEVKYFFFFISTHVCLLPDCKRILPLLITVAEILNTIYSKLEALNGL